jgi:hypothetical protein
MPRFQSRTASPIISVTKQTGTSPFGTIGLWPKGLGWVLSAASNGEKEPVPDVGVTEEKVSAGTALICDSGSGV